MQPRGLSPLGFACSGKADRLVRLRTSTIRSRVYSSREDGYCDVECDPLMIRRRQHRATSPSSRGWSQERGGRAHGPRSGRSSHDKGPKTSCVAMLVPLQLSAKGGTRVTSAEGLELRLFNRCYESVSCRRGRGGTKHRVCAGVQSSSVCASVHFRPVFAKQASCTRGRPHDLDTIEIGNFDDYAFIPCRGHVDIPVLFGGLTEFPLNRSSASIIAYEVRRAKRRTSFLLRGLAD